MAQLLFSGLFIAPRNRAPVIIKMLSFVLVALVVAGCGGGRSAGSNAGNQPQTIMVSPTSTVVQVGGTTEFGASANAQTETVNWALSCNGGSCGSVSPNSSVSAVYSAPATPPASNLTVTLTAALASDPSISASATITVPFVAVTIAPASATVESGGSQQFVPTLVGDSSNGGVTWSLTKAYTCRRFSFCPNDSSCDSSCGSFSSPNSGNGRPMIYTAPAKPPAFPANSSNQHLVLLATSVTDNIAATSVSVTLLPISVSVSPGATGVALNGTQQITATVVNDGANNGVAWNLTQNGAACSPGCGTIAPTTATGVAATYAAPATALALPAVTITATSVTDATKSANSTALVKSPTDSGSESLLNGEYAFQLQGFDSGGNPIGIVGSLTADGTGKISGGEEDSYAAITAEDDAKVDAATSVYSVGPDHRGFLALTISGAGTTYFRFALGSLNTGNIATTGRMIAFGQATGKASQASGTMRLQDPTSFTASKFKGNYVLGVSGADALEPDSLAGTFASDGVSAITSGAFDVDRPDGTASNLPSASGANFTCCSANGRGTMDLRISTTAFASSQFVFYMVSSAEALVGTDIAIDMGGGFTGELIGIPAGTTFSQSSLSGVSVVRQEPLASSATLVHIGTASADGKGTITLNDNINNAGSFSTASTTYTYTVGSNGRVALSGGSAPPVLYLYGPNQGFLVGTARNATFGILEPQAAGPFSNASFSGAYVFGTENPSASTAILESGVLTADGNGNAAGTSDQSGASGLSQNQSLNFTYSFPANGIGNVGSGTTAILISRTKLVFMNNTNANPTITVVEQ